MKILLQLNMIKIRLKPRTFKDGSFRAAYFDSNWDAIKFIYETTGDKLDIDKIPLDDEATCSMLRKGDTQGVFQLESGGMTKLVMDLGPESFEDLIP